MEENNNIFGFVSKIGSLIINSKNKEKDSKKKGQEKKYNIKISTDVDEDLDNIDNQSDEEEEEEEEDEKKDEKKEDKKELINKEELNTNQNESISEKEKIKNIVKEIMNYNDLNNNILDNEDEKEDKINNEDNNINNNKAENNNNNKYTCPPILNNSFPVADNSSQTNSSSFIYDETTSCHIMLKKGNDININEYIIFPILFMEKQKNIFYKIGMMNNPKFEQKKYLFFFDEHYLYFLKDEIFVEEMDEETRRITKIISLFDIKDFSTEHENEKFLIKLIIKKEYGKEKEITFYIEDKFFTGFIKNFNLKLSIYGIDFFSNKKQN